MKRLIAVSVEEPGGLDSLVDPRFGRAGGFVLIDPDTGQVARTLENEAASAGHGAGTGAAGLMARNGVAQVVSGRFGPKAYEALNGLGVEMWISPEGLTVAQVVRKLLDGELERMKVREFR